MSIPSNEATGSRRAPDPIPLFDQVARLRDKIDCAVDALGRARDATQRDDHSRIDWDYVIKQFNRGLNDAAVAGAYAVQQRAIKILVEATPDRPFDGHPCEPDSDIVVNEAATGGES